MKSIIVGAGTYGQVYLSYLREAGVEIVGFLDSAPALHGRQVLGTPVIGSIDCFAYCRDELGVQAVYCPLGNNRIRVDILEQARLSGLQTPSFIHRQAIVSGDAELGDGVYILPGTVVAPYATLEPYVMVASCTVVAHHTHLSRGVFLSNSVGTGASQWFHPYVFVGIGARVMTGVREIGESALVGAGAVVIRDVPPRAVVVGNPARIIRYQEE